MNCNCRPPEVSLESSADRLARLRAAVAPHTNYLHNPLPAQPGVCDICCGATEARNPTCARCREHRHATPSGLADAIVPIAYAIHGEQHYADLVSYKAARPAPLANRRLSVITELFIREHLPCLTKITGPSGPHVAVVPSTRGRLGTHPVTALLPLNAGAVLIDVTSTERYPSENRDFAADRFVATPPAVGWNSGVLLFDDTWVTGGRIQSAAYALKAAGAPTVIAIVIGRGVTESYGHAGPLLAAARANRYDSTRCRLCRPKL